MSREKRLRELRAEEGWKNGKGKQRSERIVRKKGGEKGENRKRLRGVNRGR